jgi:hypothetical protein
MSRKANCLDNACAETLFGSLKVERLHGQSFQTIREAKDEVIAWLLWYNRTRMHSTLGYVSPAQFEQRWNQVALERAACMFAPAKAGGGSAGPKKTSALGNRRGDYHTATATTATGITIPQNQPVLEYAF